MLTKLKVYFGVLAVLLLLPYYSYCEDITTQHTIYDDGYTYVPLQFEFPFYDQTFTDSWMYSNGVIGVQDPATGANGGQTYTAAEFSTLDAARFSYMIAPLWTDLINYGSGTFETYSTATSMEYRWIDIAEYGNPSNLNTFTTTIDDTGKIETTYVKVNITSHSVGVGYTGDLSAGESEQTGWYPYGTAYSTADFINWTANPSTGQAIVPIDPCTADPLSDTSCPGYATAYLEQQCTIDPLYDSSCPGYADAYYDQQCSLDPLYDSGCDGYTQAYYDQQCSISALYDTGCPGYDDLVLETVRENTTTEITESSTSNISVQVSITGNEVVDNILDVPNTTSVTSPTSVISAIIVTPDSEADVSTAKEVITVSEETSVIQGSGKASHDVGLRAKREKVKQDMIKKGKELAKKVGDAKSLQEQQEAQNLALKLVGFNPDFTDYKQQTIQQPEFYKSKEIYQESNTKSAVRNGLAQQILHTKMVEMQYDITKGE